MSVRFYANTLSETYYSRLSFLSGRHAIAQMVVSHFWVRSRVSHPISEHGHDSDSCLGHTSPQRVNEGLEGLGDLAVLLSENVLNSNFGKILWNGIPGYIPFAKKAKLKQDSPLFFCVPRKACPRVLDEYAWYKF